MRPIRFRYTNWRGEEHIYLVMPEPTLTYGSYGVPGRLEEDMSWLISGYVIERDGEPYNKRRTFQLPRMQDIVLVDA